jgi:hypothetical protein
METVLEDGGARSCQEPRVRREIPPSMEDAAGEEESLSL